MIRVSVLSLNLAKGSGLVWREYDSKFLGGIVADGLGDKVGECHGMAAVRAVMRLDTRVSRRARLSDSPML